MRFLYLNIFVLGFLRYNCVCLTSVTVSTLFWTSSLLLVSPIMKGFFDLAWPVWSLGSSIYDYIQKNEAEKHINSLNDHIHSLKGKIATQEINIHSLQNVMYAKDDIIHTQRCIIDMLFAVLIAMLVVMCTLLFMKRKN